jgi:hypothetical protein
MISIANSLLAISRIRKRGCGKFEPVLEWSRDSHFVGHSYSLHCNPQFQTLKLFLSHAFQSHRCNHIQGGNVFHFVARRCLATKLLYFWVSAHLQKHFIRIGYRQSLCDQAVLNKNAMIRRCRQCCWRVLLGALEMFWVFHCSVLTRFLNEVISLAATTWSCSSPQAERNVSLINIVELAHGLSVKPAKLVEPIR